MLIGDFPTKKVKSFSLVVFSHLVFCCEKVPTMFAKKMLEEEVLVISNFFLQNKGLRKGDLSKTQILPPAPGNHSHLKTYRVEKN